MTVTLDLPPNVEQAYLTEKAYRLPTWYAKF
jgi:hypothetical protein